jgi:hypothetical protein
MRKACERAGVDGLTFHDLRGTAVVRLAIAGASVPQIAAVTGHSLKDVEAILDAHYLGRDTACRGCGAEARSENKTVNGGVNGTSFAVSSNR